MNKKSFVFGILTGIVIAVVIGILFVAIKDAIKNIPDITSIELFEAQKTTPAAQSPANIGEQWEIIPINVQVESLGGGWKSVVADFAVSNGSNQWGSLFIPYNVITQISLETNEGYVYYAEPPSSVSGSFIGSSTNYFNYLPPGFRVRGDSSIHIGVQGGRLSRLYFQVAENTTGYKVTIPQYSVYIYSPEAREPQEVKVEKPIVLDLKTDIRAITYPTDLPSDQFRSFNTPMVAEEIGTVFLDSFSSEDFSERKKLILHMTFQNASSGYEQSLALQLYMIGKEGILYDNNVWGETSFHAGPAQTATSTAEFLVLPTDGDFKLIIWLINTKQVEIIEVGSQIP